MIDNLAYRTISKWRSTHGHTLTISKLERDRYFESLSTMAYVEKYLPPGRNRNEVYKLLDDAIGYSYKPKHIGTFETYNHQKHNERLRLKAIGAYESQVSDFLGSIEKYRHKSKLYSSEIASTSLCSERFWSFGEL